MKRAAGPGEMRAARERAAQPLQTSQSHSSCGQRRPCSDAIGRLHKSQVFLQREVKECLCRRWPRRHDTLATECESLLRTGLPCCGLTLRLGSSNCRYLRPSSGTARDDAERRTRAWSSATRGGQVVPHVDVADAAAVSAHEHEQIALTFSFLGGAWERMTFES